MVEYLRQTIPGYRRGVNQDGSSPSRLISPLSKRVSLSQQIRSPELTSKNGSPRITPQQRKSPHRRGSSGSKSSNESPSRILVSPRKGWPQKIKVPRARPPYLSRGSASSRRGGAPTHMDSHSEEVMGAAMPIFVRKESPNTHHRARGRGRSGRGTAPPPPSPSHEAKTVSSRVNQNHTDHPNARRVSWSPMSSQLSWSPKRRKKTGMSAGEKSSSSRLDTGQVNRCTGQSERRSSISIKREPSSSGDFSRRMSMLKKQKRNGHGGKLFEVEWT